MWIYVITWQDLTMRRQVRASRNQLIMYIVVSKGETRSILQNQFIETAMETIFVMNLPDYLARLLKEREIF